MSLSPGPCRAVAARGGRGSAMQARAAEWVDDQCRIGWCLAGQDEPVRTAGQRSASVASRCQPRRAGSGGELLAVTRICPQADMRSRPETVTRSQNVTACRAMAIPDPFVLALVPADRRG